MWQKIFLLILLTSFSQAARKCGHIKIEKSTALINNGNASYPGQWPWLAPLFNATNDAYLCGSSIISKWHLLSAAHCVLNAKADGRYALLGRFDITNSSETHWQRRNISDFYAHSDYNPNAKLQKSRGDIAVLKMTDSAEFTDYIQPICLPDVSTNVINLKGISAGYGLTNPLESTNPVRPNHAELKSIDRFKCLNRVSNYIHIVSEFSFCAGDTKSITCQGDSGGGFYIYDQSTFQYQIIGIVSYALVHCDPTEYVVFTDVTKYLPWIYEITDLTDKCFKVNCGVDEKCKIDINGKTLCVCPPGFNGSPPHCMQKCSNDPDCPGDRKCYKDTCVDFCSNPNLVCDMNANCKIKNHEVECECKDGYAGNGLDCTLDSNFIDGVLNYFDDQIEFQCSPFCIEKFLTFVVRNSIGSDSNETKIIPSNRNETVEMMKIDEKSFVQALNHMPMKIGEENFMPVNKYPTSEFDSMSFLSTTSYLPVNVYEIFPNLKKYIVESQSLQLIRGENFLNLNILEKLEISENKVELIVEKFAFDDLAQLKELKLCGNKMTSLPDDLLENNDELVSVNLNDNRLTSLNVIRNLNKLIELDSSNNNFTTLPEDIFTNLRLLEILTLDGTQLNVIPEKIFENSPFLKILDLSSNQLIEIPENLFAHNTRLKKMHLGSNRLSSLTAGIFHGLTELTVLFIDTNQLTTLPEDIFIENSNLLRIDLSKNEIEFLNSQIFKSAVQLKEIDLSWNKLESLPSDIFSENIKIEKIYLQSNKIMSLTSDFLKYSFELEEIDMSFNGLTSMPENIFSVNQQLEKVTLGGNNISSISWRDFEKKPKLTCVELAGNVCVDANFGCLSHQVLAYNERASLKSILKSKCKF